MTNLSVFAIGVFVGMQLGIIFACIAAGLFRR